MKVRYILACSACVVLTILAAATLGGQAQSQPAAQGGQPAAPPPAQAAPPPAQAGHPSGRLVLWGDVALFNMPTDPDNCILTNRFKRGQRVGFRMTAIDGGTSDVENSAVLVAAVAVARLDSLWPDFVVGVGIALLFLRTAATVLRESVAELVDSREASAESS